MNTVLVALGLKADADELTALGEVQKLVALESEIKLLAGADKTGDAIGVLVALKAKAEKADVLETELTKLRADQATADVKSLLDEATKDGRITPAKRGEFEQLQAKHGVDALRTCLSMLPKAASPAVPPAGDAPSAAAIGMFSAEQVDLIKKIGADPAAVAKHTVSRASFIATSEEK